MNILLENIMLFIATDHFEKLMTLLISAINIWIAYRIYEFTKKDINPKLYIDSEILNSEDTETAGYSIIINTTLDKEDFNKKGFPEIQHDPLLWQLKIFNNGELPATNVFVEYSISIKRAEFDYGIDEADIINQRFNNYKTVHKIIKFDYIPPESKKVINIMYLYGYFPYADLKINKLKSDERSFINQPTHIHTYEHPVFWRIEDSNHSRKMLGVGKKEY